MVDRHTNLLISIMEPEEQGYSSEQKEPLPGHKGNTTGYTTFYFDEKQMRPLPQNFKLPEGEYLVGQYAFATDKSNEKSYIARGGSGIVFKGYRCDSRQNPEVAIKVMDIRNDKYLQLYRQEALRQQLVASDGIVKVLMTKTFPQSQGNIFVIVYELMDGGELSISQEGHSHQEALQILKEILVCYKQLYKRGMTHRDLKPKNILVKNVGDKRIIKISDFGAVMEKADKRNNNPSTPQYASPQQRKNRQYTDKCDVFAIGCLFFQLLMGKTPQRLKCTKGYNIMDMNKVKEKLYMKNVPEDMINFIEGCLRQHQTVEMVKNGVKMEDPQKSRFSWDDVYLHPIFKGQLDYVPRQVTGKNILLTIKTNAISNQVDLVKLLENILDTSESISKQQLKLLFEKYQIIVSESDINRFERIFAKQGVFQVRELIHQVNNLDKHNEMKKYTSKEALAFAQMFNYIGNKQLLQNIQNFKKWKKDLQFQKYQKIVDLSLKSIDFTSFPLLPPMYKLNKIKLYGALIYTLNIVLDTPNLQQIHLTSCQTQRIISIKGCSNLTHLDLQSNNLRQIQGLQNCLKLQYLNFQRNRLRKISNISHLKKLNQLFLIGNRITTIDGIAGCTSLQYLYLHKNRIKDLGQNFLETRKVPLKQIFLYENKTKNNEKNREILKKMKNIHPNLKVYLGGGKSNQQFEDIQETGQFQNGLYRILWYLDPSKCLGIKVDQNGNRKIHLVDVDEQVQQQRWYFKLIEEEEYCIYTFNQKQIVKDNIKNGLYLLPSQQNLQYEDDNRFRWRFVKIKNTLEQPIYRITEIILKIKPIFYTSDDQIMAFLGCNLETDLWYILPWKG